MGCNYLSVSEHFVPKWKQQHKNTAIDFF